MSNVNIEELVSYLQYQQKSSKVIEKYKEFLLLPEVDKSTLPKLQKSIIDKVIKNFIGL